MANLAIGVYHAGYGLREELPILAVVFILPAVAAMSVWGLGRGRAAIRRAPTRARR